MEKQRVLFVCIHNSARSQIAEAFLNACCSDKYQAQSAGIEPGNLNPTVVEVMKEIGIDLTNNRTKSVNEFLGQPFDWVITVCEKEAAEKCPVFPGKGERLQWSFPDPSKFEGTPEVRLSKTREVRDSVTSAVRNWCGC